jgi:biopolymer transport protein ExbD
LTSQTAIFSIDVYGKSERLHHSENSFFMAEITQHSEKNRKGNIRSKKQSTKIDMTPMVDLAFLLLTFFILTTTLTKQTALQVEMPEKIVDPADIPRVNVKDVLTLVLAEDNKLYWWMEDDPVAKVTSYSRNGIRKILLEKGQQNSKLVIQIKPKDNCNYENMVDILDEMHITRMLRYAIVEVNEEDESRLLAVK